MATYTFEKEAEEYASIYIKHHSEALSRKMIACAFLRGANGLKPNTRDYHSMLAFLRGSNTGGRTPLVEQF